ncbi:hypothetical protein [Lactiplantibacillus plantarum]|uniref:hypothetical protein n=1 Tax=Lactiplantibacillus plantarum TaxID=1590 RepID=UPI0025B3E2CC|nr:hypothetical protein [Lactiplantibacillus plantarum]MDN3983911.1 hypothetical protein [Lactiplantibacillus plantarum]
MAESNATQVILTDDGIKIIKAQNMADNAAGGVTNLNDPNFMSVIEKQTQATQYAGLTSQYNVILSRAKDANVSTADLTTAYTNLNTFMAAILTDTAKASDVNRDTYKELTDDYNTALSDVQNALKDAYNTDIANMQSSVSVASQAASSAAIVASQATITGDNASQAAAQASMAANQAKSAGDNATSVANNASQAASGAVIAGSTASVKADKAINVASQAQTDVNSAASIASQASKDASKAIFAGSQAAASAQSALEAAQDTAKKYESLGMYKAWANTSPQNQNMNSWVWSDPAKKAASITYANGVNTIDYTGVSGYETFNMPIHAKVGDKVSVTFGYTQPAVVSLNGSNNGVPVSFSNQILEHAAIGDNPIYLGVNAQSNKVYTISTTATSETMYLSFNFGYLRDGTNWKFGLSVQQDMTIEQPTVLSEYIGFSTTQSNNPADYTWLRNPDELEGEVQNQITIASNNAESKMVQTINHVGVGFKNPDGTTYTLYLTADGTALLDFNKIMLNGQTNIQSGTIGTAQIADAAITEAKIGSLAVGTAQIKDAAINSAKIADLAVGTAQIGDGAITNAKIGKLAVGSAQIADLAVTNAKIGNVSANKLTAGTIDFNTITGKNINASNITTGTISTNRLNVGKLSALSADLGNVTAGSLKGVNIVAKTFSTPNGSFTTDANGAITAKNMTLTGGTLTSPTINASAINGSTINGGTLNMQTDGLINSPYTGIQQTADQFYHPWKLNTGQLTIGQGYITSVSSGTRSINGVPKQFDSVQGTLSASYLKFTNNYGSRTYIDADMFTYSNQTNDTAMVAISASGVGINMGTMSAPALTISNGYIDASSSSSYGKFGAITLGYNAHTVNSDSSLFFESGYGSGNPGINIWAKGFHSLSSRLSTKRQVRLLDDEHSNSLLLGADTATFQYNQDTNADNSNEGVIIDDVNTAKQYNLPDELITRDGNAPADLMSFIARIISQNKYQARLIEDLQIRLRKVEINNG